MKPTSTQNQSRLHPFSLMRRLQALLFALILLLTSTGLPAVAEDDAAQPNIYGMVQTRKLEKKQLTASLNGDSMISVTYGQAAQIPDGAQLVVTPITDEAAYVQQAKKDLNVKSVDFVQLFDMGIYYDGVKIEPADKVKISFRLTEDMKRDGDLRIVHFPTDPEPITSQEAETAPAVASQKMMSVKGTKATPMTVEPQDDDDDLMPVQAASLDTPVTEELNLILNEENIVSFETYGFSVFGVCYTVDFEYVDEQGETHTWSFPGTGSYAIADIMSEIGVEGTITDVQLARTIDEGGAENALYLSDDHTELVSDVAFQDTFELTVRVQQTIEERIVEKTYVIVVTDDLSPNAHHTITVEIEQGVTISGNIFIVLYQRPAYREWGTLQEDDYYNSVKYDGQSSYSLDNYSTADTTIFLFDCGSDSAFSEYNQGNYTKYGDTIADKTLSIDTDQSTNSTTITIGDVLPTDYTASLTFVDQTTNTLTVPDLTGYTLVGSVGTDTYTAPLAEGQLSFTKDGTPVSELPKITGWTLKQNGVDSSNNMIGDFELSTTPETTTVSSTEISVLKNYAFTATKYQDCGLAIEGLTDPNAVANYWVLVKQGSEYKYYARMYTLGTIFNADGTSASTIKGSTGYEFEVVERNDSNAPNDVNDLSNQQKKPNLFSITDNGYTKLVTFPTQATNQSGNYNYVFTVADPPKYSASLSFMQEDGITPANSTGLTGEYYVLIKISRNGEKYALSETAIDLTSPAPVTFDTFDSNESLRYLGDGEILEAWLVKNTSGSGAPTLDDAKNGTNVTKIQLTNNAVLGGYELSASSAQGGNWTSTFSMLPKYSATFSFMQSDGNTPVASTGISDSYYVLIKAGNYYGLSENAVDFTEATDTVTFEEFFDSDNNNVGGYHYKNDTIQEIYLVKNVDDNNKPSIANARTGDSSVVTRIQLQESATFEGYVLSAPTFQNGAWSGTFTEVPNYSANIQVIDTDGTTQIANPSISGTYYYLIKTNIGSEKFALSEQPVDFTGANPAEFTYFYNNDGTGEVVSGYSGNLITEVYLVTPDSSGQRPSISDAYAGSNGVQKYGVGAYTTNNILENRYLLTGSADGPSYLITASRMPYYAVTSDFVDGNNNAVPKALSKGYYLVAKATIGENTTHYIDTYDPAGEYEITHFYTSPNLTGGGDNEGKTAFVNGSTVEVYLVEKANAADANAAISAAGANKIDDGKSVEIYTLAVTPGTNQTALTFTRGEAETYTTTIKFFTENAQIIEAAGDIGMHVDEANSTKKAPNLTKHYYVLATLTSKTDKSLAGWAINPVSPSGHAETSTLFTEFTPCDNTGVATGGASIPFYSSDDFPYNITTRLFHTDAALTAPTYKDLVTDKISDATDSAESGYEFVGNWNPDATHNEIHLKETSPKTYAVRVRFKTEDVSKLVAIGNDGYYVVHVIVTHADGNESVQYDRIQISDFSNLPVDDEGYLYKEFQFEYWKKTDGGYVVKTDADSNPKFTGNEQYIKVELVKSSNNNGYEYNNYRADGTSVYAEGTSAGAYVVHYDTRWTNPQNTLSRFHEEPVPGSDVVKCYDIIDLILPNADSEYDYSTILGPNYAFGIVADHLFHNNDLQTNFAVNHYTGHGDYVAPDLSNTSGMIVIGEFNRNTDIMAENHVGPAVDPTSEDGEDIKAGTVPLGNNILGSLTIYADNDSGSRYDTYGIAGGTPVSEVRDNVHVYMQNGENLQNQIVNPGIRYAVNMSRTLAAKEATYTPEMRGGKPYVDTTGFPDAATIYIDADSMLKVSDETPGDVYGTLYELRELTINKKPDQMLIFNFKDPKTVNVKLNQFKVGDFATQTTTNSGTVINQTMDQLSKHIVWNFASCTRRVELSEIGGICLQPNYGSETQITGTSGGWLVSAGYVFNSSAEWHNFFQEVPENTKVTLRVMKTVDDKVPAYREADDVANPPVPANKEIFDFELYEYKVGDSSSGWTVAPLATQQNIRSSVKFEIEDPAGTPEEEKKLTPGWHVYKIVEKQEKPAGNTTANNYIFDTNEYFAAVRVTASNGVMIAGAPMYFSSFDPALFNQAAIESADIPAALTDPLVTVTFKNEVKKEGLTVRKIVEGTDSSKVPFTFKIKVWQSVADSTTALSDSAADYPVTGLAGTSKITLTPAGEAPIRWSEGTLRLKNGQSATITGLPVGSHYEITETHINGTEITYTGTTADPVEGYTAKTEAQTGEIISGGVKEEFVNEYHASGSTTLYVHKELKNTTTTLPADAYGFELHQGSTRIGDTIYNDASGNAEFPALRFTEEDMEGAVLNPFTGKRVKVLTYRVHEVNGTLTDFAYDQFINDTDKLIVVTLTDNGDGRITAATFPADATFRFNNDKGIEVALDGSKILIGRDMKSGETFRFVATETVNEIETIVATAAVRNARDGEEAAFTFTPIKYREAGEHTYTITEVEGTNSTLNYDTTTSYTAIVNVTEDADGKLYATVTYISKKAFINTSKESTSVPVEKVWTDGNQNHTNDRVKVKLFKTYGSVVDPQPSEGPATYMGTGTDTTETGGMEIERPGTDYLPADAIAIAGTEIMLTRANGWKYVWSMLPTMEKVNDGGTETWKYVNYYPVEVWSSVTVSYTSYQTEQDGLYKKVIINNTPAPQLGALQLKKLVTVDSKTESEWSEADKATYAPLVDGAYLFTIKGPDSTDVVKKIWIVVENGVMTRVIDYDDYDPDWIGWGLWYNPENIQTIDGNGVTIDDLVPGNYTVEESQYGYKIRYGEELEGDFDGMIGFGGDYLEGVTLKTVTGSDSEHPSITGNVNDRTITLTVSSGGTATAQAVFTNNYDEPGALKIKKVVHVNGDNPTTSDQNALVDGAYDFQVVGPMSADEPDREIKYVRIIIKDGIMINYDIKDSQEALGVFSNDAGWGGYESNETDRWVTVADLVPGDYEITELGWYQVTGDVNADTTKPIEHITLESIEGGKAAEGTYTGPDTTSRKVTVTVTAGDNAPANDSAAAATYINNCEVGSLSLKKILDPSESILVYGDSDKMSGTYSFTVQGPLALDENTQAYVTQADTATQYVRIRTQKINGRQYFYSQTSSTGTDWSTETELDGYLTFKELTPGYYRITETDSTLTNQPGGTEVYLKSIDVVDASGNAIASASPDLATQSVVVQVTASNTAVVRADFTNELTPSTPDIKKQVVDVNDSTQSTVGSSGPEDPWYDSADHDIGDQVPYRVSGFLPQKIYRASTAYYYQVVDEMENLEYVSGSGRMYAFVKGPNDPEGNWYDVTSFFVGSGDFTPTTSGNIQTLRTESVDLKTLRGSYPRVTSWLASGSTHSANVYPSGMPQTESGTINDANDIQYLQLRYKATLTENANIGVTGNRNDATIYYRYTNADGTTVTDHTATDRNRVFTYKLRVNKTDDQGTEISGAEFELYKYYETYTIHSGDKQCAYDNKTFIGPEDHLPAASAQNASATTHVYVRVDPHTSSAGTWNGIDDGTYLLIETHAPAGFKPLSDPIGFSIVASHQDNADNPQLTGFTFTPNSGYTSWFTAEMNSGTAVLGSEVGTIPNTPYPGIRIVKQDSSNSTPLAGAEFTLYKWNASNSAYEQYIPTGETTAVRATAGENGEAEFQKVEPGEYKLVETKAPIGYIGLAHPVYFNVDDTGSSRVVTMYDKPCSDDSRTEINATENTIGVIFTSATFTVDNTPGVELPSTGGPGTAAYLATGLALMALALVLTRLRKRVQA